jgi:hypothetical protein
MMAIVSPFPAIPKLLAEFGGQARRGISYPGHRHHNVAGVPGLAPIAGIISDRFGRRTS